VKVGQLGDRKPYIVDAQLRRSGGSLLKMWGREGFLFVKSLRTRQNSASGDLVAKTTGGGGELDLCTRQ